MEIVKSSHTLRRSLYVSVFLLIASPSTAFSSSTVFQDASSKLPPALPQGTDSVDADFVDVDNDGDLDIFIAEGTAGFEGRANRLLLNDGRGNYTDVSASNLPFSPRPFNSTSADAADFDGDGDMDIVVANLGPTQLLLNNGSGVFTDASRTLLPPPPPNIIDDISTEIAFIDVDKDGDLDIFVTNEIPPIPGVGPGGSQNFLYILQNGFYTDESLARLPNVKNQSASFVFGDIDKDGDADLIVANVGVNALLLNDGNGFFSADIEGRIPTEVTTSRSIELGDLDRDGDLDLVIANSNQEQNQIFENQGAGFFVDITDITLPALGDTSSDVKLLDLNFDRRLDIIFANSIPNPAPPGTGHPLAPAPNIVYINKTIKTPYGTRWRIKDASKRFLPATESISFDTEYGDANGDKLPDLLIANANDGTEELLLRVKMPPPPKRLIPKLVCVEPSKNKSFIAYFAYINGGKRPGYLPVGPRNRLFPPRANNNQPVIFLLGKSTPDETFAVPFRYGATWLLNGRVAVAHRGSKRCK